MRVTRQEIKNSTVHPFFLSHVVFWGQLEWVWLPDAPQHYSQSLQASYHMTGKKLWESYAFNVQTQRTHKTQLLHRGPWDKISECAQFSCWEAVRLALTREKQVESLRSQGYITKQANKHPFPVHCLHTEPLQHLPFQAHHSKVQPSFFFSRETIGLTDSIHSLQATMLEKRTSTVNELSNEGSEWKTPSKADTSYVT